MILQNLGGSSLAFRGICTRDDKQETRLAAFECRAGKQERPGAHVGGRDPQPIGEQLEGIRRADLIAIDAEGTVEMPGQLYPAARPVGPNPGASRRNASRTSVRRQSTCRCSRSWLRP
jgi:hypothetical protein